MIRPLAEWQTTAQFPLSPSTTLMSLFCDGCKAYTLVVSLAPREETMLPAVERQIHHRQRRGKGRG